MKTLRSTIFATLFAFALSGTALAGSSIGNILMFPLIDQAIAAIVEFIGDDHCPVRVCGGCKPGTGDCRPVTR